MVIVSKITALQYYSVITLADINRNILPGGCIHAHLNQAMEITEHLNQYWSIYPNTHFK